MATYEYVLARRDVNGPYGPENCYWRKAHSAKEAQRGIEDLGLEEPDTIPLTTEQQQQRDELPEEQRHTFDIWARMQWRRRHYGSEKH
jgi:hypothetical protein